MLDLGLARKCLKWKRWRQKHGKGFLEERVILEAGDSQVPVLQVLPPTSQRNEVMQTLEAQHCCLFLSQKS